MVVVRPVEEDTPFGDFFRRQTGRRYVQFMNDPGHPITHCLPVCNRGAHVGKDGKQAVFQCLQAAWVGFPIDFDMHDRLRLSVTSAASGYRLQFAARIALGAEHRMDQKVQRMAQAIDLHGYRIDQKGHVIVEYFDDGMGRGPAVLFDLRVVYPELRCATGKSPAEGKLRQRGAIKVFDSERQQILGIHLLIVGRDEAFCLAVLGCGKAADCQFEHGGKRVLLFFFEMIEHDFSFCSLFPSLTDAGASSTAMAIRGRHTAVLSAPTFAGFARLQYRQ